MPDIPRERDRPFIWPSWVKRLLSGEDQCWFKTWYKVHYFYEKRPDPDEKKFDEYNRKHDEIVRKRAAQLRTEGWETLEEEAGAFTLVGEAGDFRGKPDIVGRRGREVIVVDAKSGKPRDSDHWQVLTYMFALPLTWLKDFDSLIGQVEYPDERRVQVRLLGPVEKDQIIRTLKKVSGPEEPAKVPSAFECKYCDVAACPSRYRENESGATGYF